eukprot:gb/GFBE01072949.1/.p1 GENE.gb/GFBE01072949.1/~~gb/GFBE01072949.1/.p1  ORF type:complete len:165 (+),score=32.04 gb/GFBE01072949.1/:1-495(+)
MSSAPCAEFPATQPCFARLQKELQELNADPPAGCWATGGLAVGQRAQWQASVAGPEGSPYEGGFFNLALSFSKAYPHEAPEVIFTTKIFHCNVQLDGALALSAVLSDWNPVFSIAELLVSVRSLLAEPKPESAAVPEIAALYRHSRAEHDRLARASTRRFATDA